eukprot:COSAG06_NODE_20741_length_783_cov_1.385965_1_plen_40_part_01
MNPVCVVPALPAAFALIARLGEGGGAASQGDVEALASRID